MALDIRVDDVTRPEITALIGEHLTGMHANSPPESVHALGLEALREPAVTMWSAWVDGMLAGCGALKALGDDQGEIKSMRTRPAFLRQGIGAAILETIMAEARLRGYRSLWLETGSGAAFDPAHRLYQRYGFTYCGPFGAYTDDSFSQFMTLSLD